MSATNTRIRILEDSFDPAAMSAEMTASNITRSTTGSTTRSTTGSHTESTTGSSTENNTHGALVTFTGMVRDLVENPVNAMLLEHYPGMTERALEAIIHKARERWTLGDINITHRVGMLYPGEPIVFVGVSSAHRREAFEACQFLMDYLKIEAPFWKKEFTPDGEHWVEAKSSDTDAAGRW
ncbi:MAG: molybdopterin synthase catalytic subunit MoaE [Porticoccaceae bacterium]